MATMRADTTFMWADTRPFLDKYDLTKHPNYLLTSAADERNYFDVEKYLHRQLKLRDDDVYDVVDADALESAVI